MSSSELYAVWDTSTNSWGPQITGYTFYLYPDDALQPVPNAWDYPKGLTEAEYEANGGAPEGLSESDDDADGDGDDDAGTASN